MGSKGTVAPYGLCCSSALLLLWEPVSRSRSSVVSSFNLEAHLCNSNKAGSDFRFQRCLTVHDFTEQFCQLLLFYRLVTTAAQPPLPLTLQNSFTLALKWFPVIVLTISYPYIKVPFKIKSKRCFQTLMQIFLRHPLVGKLSII